MSMFVAINEHHNLVHISDVIRGLACQCTCVECGETVVAKKGELKEHHFAHASNKDSCFINPESLLHKYAKQVIAESLGLMLPALPNDDAEAAWWTFERIIPEFHLGAIRPDLVAYTEEEPVFIEIAVTHFIDKQKLAIIKSLNVKTVEIDLSSLLKTDMSIPSEAARQVILSSLENKYWVFPEMPVPIEAEKQVDDTSCDLTTVMNVVDSQIAPPTWEDFKFTINGIWVNVRKFSGGMLSVNCTYNPEIIAMLKQWRNEGSGKYNSKYKSWNYWQPFSETVLERLQQMHCIEKS